MMMSSMGGGGGGSGQLRPWWREWSQIGVDERIEEWHPHASAFRPIDSCATIHPIALF